MAYFYYLGKRVFIVFSVVLLCSFNSNSQTPIPGHAASIVNGSGGALLSQPSSVFVFGNFAYVASYGSNALEILDITDPTLPTHKGSVSLNGANSVFVLGSFAYVTCSASNNSLAIVDISVPTSPSITGSIANGTGGALLTNPVSVYVFGNYAYVASAGANALEIIDISTPSSPTHVGSLSDGTGGANLNSPNSVFVSGTTVYVASFGSDALEIVDASDPSLPAHKGSISNGTGILLSNPTSVFVSGNYAYVASYGSDALEIVNVSDPTLPVHAGSLTNGTGGALLSGPKSLFVSGNYCYIASGSSNALEIVDISDATSPAHVTSLVNGSYGALLGNPQDVFVSGNYAYLAASGNAVEVVSIFSPVVPVAIAATLVDQDQFQANWNVVGNASGYFVDVSTDNFSTLVSGYDNVSVATNSLSITGLSSATNYQYRVRSTNTNGTSSNSSTISVLTIPATPVATTATSITPTGFVANWNTVGGAVNYHIDVATDAGFSSLVSGYNNVTATSNSLAVTGLSSGVTYYYQVRSVNATGSSPSSNTISQITIPPNPTSLTATAIGQTSFTANWSAATGASGYFLDVATDAAFSFLLSGYNNLSVATTSAVVTGLTGGTTYYYRVKATNSGGTSGNSSKITVLTIPSTPAATSATSVTQNTFTANWSTATGASGYFIDVATDGAFSSLLTGYNNLAAASNSIGVTGISPGVTYYYRVRAENATGISGSSNTISQITVPSNPTSLPGNAIDETSFTANWSATTGASGYFLDVATDVGFSSILSGYNNLAVATASSTVTGLSGGTNYYYRVRATNSGGTSGNSSIITVLTIPSAPVATAATSVSQNSFVANWATSVGASGYFLDVALDGAFNSIFSGYNNLSVASTSSSVTGLAGGVTYYYRVRAANGVGASGNSSTISVITIPATPVASSATSITQTGFIANWSTVTGAANYHVDVATDAGFSSLVSGYNNVSVASDLLTITGLSSGVTYYYQVRAVNATGSSPSSNTISQITIPPNPSVLAGSAIGQTSFTANWAASAGASGYFLDVAIDAAFSSMLSGYNNLSVATTSSPITGLTGGTTYYYRVRAADSGGLSGNSSTITVLTIPSAPVAASATSVTSNSFTANWVAAVGASGYFLDVALDGAFSSVLSGYNNLSVASTSSAITGLAGGVTYYYRVRATNSGGTSGNSSTISVLTLPGPLVATAATTVTQSSFVANWAAVSGAINYEIDVSTDAAFSSFIAGFNNLSVPSNSTSVTGLAAGTTYYYRVRSVNGSGSSPSSNTISQITIPPNPSSLAGSAIGQTSFTANWSAATGASGYFLDVATDGAFSSMLSGYNNLSVATTSSSVTGLTDGTTYYYRVRASNGGGASGNSSSTSVLTITATPVATAATSITQTGFVANWNTVSGAANYHIDVATDAGFSSLVSGYNNLLVASNSVTVAGLSPGITYYYYVRSANATGSSSSSNTISQITIPPNPNSLAGSAIGQTSFTANWSTTTGASSYFLDVATDAAFSSMLSGYNNLSVASTSTAVTGLTGGTNYYYRVRATDSGGTSGNSSTTTVLTVPAAPLAAAATSVTQNSFVANWVPSVGATGYFLDVALDGAFSSIITGYNNAPVASSSSSVTGLANGVTYYYRVRAANGGGPSGNSSTISVITIPATPVANAATSITQNSFTANWSAMTGATSYTIDVATDAAFNFFVTGYNNLSVVSNALAVTGLSSGTSYYYRVRSANSAGSSGSSATSSLITIPSTPTSSPPSSISQTSFTANWIGSSGASGYFLDVATDATFSSILSGYNNLSVSSTSVSVTGLTSGTTYFFRVRATNAGGTSGNSGTITSLTLAAPPLAATATSVTVNSFVANWSSVNGATSYNIDVATDSGFTGLVYSNVNAGNLTSYAVTSLNAATPYYYRVKANNASGSSTYSNVVSTSTLVVAPSTQPGAITFSQQTGTAVTVTFQAANSAPDGYIALRASSAVPNTAPVPGSAYVVGASVGNAIIAYQGSATNFNESSLPTNTQYYYSIYSYNGTGATINYLTSAPAQGNVILDVVAPVITFPNPNPTTVANGSAQTLGLTVHDNFNVTSVQLFHRGISKSTFNSEPVTNGVNGAYSIPTQISWYDSLGMEYYFIATDENGNTTSKPTPTFLVKVIQSSVTYKIPSSHGNGARDYQIFSFPYNLSSGNTVTTVFPNVASKDASKFRMLWYNPVTKGYDEYAKNSFSSLDMGKGYWLLTSEATSVTVTDASAPSFDRSNLYSVTLLPGWNQIGNPYPVAIEWSDVQNFVGQSPGVDTLSLYVYKSGWTKLKSTETLLPFSGGFVKNPSSSSITVFIPFKGQTLLGGRENAFEVGSDISQNLWQVDLNIFQGENGNRIGGIGMAPKAHYGFDRYDESNPPAFAAMPELMFHQKEISVTDLARSVVPTQTKYVWRFTVSGEWGQASELNWNADLGQGSEQLFLLDEYNMRVIDMRAQQKYSFSLQKGHSFKIFFGNDVEISTDEILVTKPFPNPTVEGKSNFALGLPDSNYSYQVNIQVFNSSGELVHSDFKSLSRGIHEVQWQADANVLPGLYLYRVSVSDGSRNFASTGKIIVP